MKLKNAGYIKRKGRIAEVHHLKLALCVFGIRNAYDFILTRLWKTLSNKQKHLTYSVAEIHQRIQFKHTNMNISYHANMHLNNQASTI